MFTEWQSVIRTHTHAWFLDWSGARSGSPQLAWPNLLAVCKLIMCLKMILKDVMVVIVMVVVVLFCFLLDWNQKTKNFWAKEKVTNNNN